MSDDLLDLINGGPGNHRIVARRADRFFDESQRFVIKAALKNVHSYKGHEMGTRSDGKIVISAYGKEFGDMDAAHAWVDDHVKAERVTKSFNPLDLVKSGKPPSGFHPIPGGKQGGYTNGKVGRQRRYWYPHDADVDAAANHHRAEAGRLKMEHRGRMTASGYPKDKAAKKELENHHHAASAVQYGDYRVGAAPKKKRAPKKPAASAVEQAKDLGQKYAATKPGSAARARIAKKRDALIQAASGMDAQMEVHNAFHRASQKAIFDRNKVEADKVLASTKKPAAKKPAAKKPAAKKPAASKIHKVSATSSERYRSGGKTITKFLIHDPSLPGKAKFQSYEGHGATPAARKKHAMEQHAKKHGIEKPIRHSKDPDGSRAASEAASGVGRAKDRKKGPATGMHRISLPGGRHKEVKSHQVHGLYSIHKEGRKYTITHTPSGMGLGTGSLTAMKKLAQHMDEHAGQAGSGGKFGKSPGKADMARMTAAYKTHNK